MAATVAQRKQAERDRQRALGRKSVELWVHPEDRKRLQLYAERLNKRRRP